MATLFFDGFDRGTVLGRLDPQYWSTQYRNDPGYAFGGYSYDHNSTNYSNQYKTVSINNGTLPSGTFYGDFGENTNPFGGYDFPGNYYPAFGTPPGFLALSNIPINDTNFLAPITYIQLSGFPQAQGTKTYFGARFLGLETKHTDYDSRIDSLRFDKPGRFDYRHPLLAFCSGNTTGLLISIIKATGNNLQLLENQKMTMGLQVEQNGQILGVFDLNMNDTINQYHLSSVFHNYAGGATIDDIGGKILTLGYIRTAPNMYSYRSDLTFLFSRWNHLEFLINKDGENSYIAAKIEGVDVPVIDIDDTNSDKETWLLEIPISGFAYNNIRFFNRTYYKDLIPLWLEPNLYDGQPYNVDSFRVVNHSAYYTRGATTLIDDITLIDDVGQPGFWLGPTAKVLPLSPGISTNLDNNGNISDGLLEWTTNSSSQRRALKNFDGDIGVLETTVSGAISAVRFDNHNFGADSSSAWRTQFNDGIAGIKIYNNARKNFLDTQFANVFFTGISDNQATYTQLLINTDRDIYDVTNKNTLSKIEPISLSYGIQKFDDPSIYFPNNESYLYMPYGNLYRSESSAGFPYPHPDNFFTIESWVYFQNGNEKITLYGKKPPTSYPQIADFRLDIPSTNFDIVCTTGYIQYSTYIDDELLGYRRLYFPQSVPTGTWNHVALVNDAIQDFRGKIINNVRYYNHQYRLISYLNGVSGTTHTIWNNLDNNLSVYTTNGNPYGWSPSANSYSTSVNLDFGPNISGVSVLAVAGAVSGLGNNLSPLTGLFQEYFPTIKIPENTTWRELINFPTNIIGSNFGLPGGWPGDANGSFVLAGLYNGRPVWNSTFGPWGANSFIIRWNGSAWVIYSSGYQQDFFVAYSDTPVPPKTNWFTTGSVPNPNVPINGQLAYTLPIPNMSALNILPTRCNNRLAYMITSAGLPELTGLYCLDGIFNNAFYYVNTDNPDYYLYNPSYLGSRRWVIGSGLYNNNEFNNNFYAKYVAEQTAPTTENLLAAESLYEASAKIVINTANNSNTTFTLLKNNIAQRNLSRNSDGVLSGILPVVSGDIITLRADYATYPSLTTTNPPSVSLQLSLSSPIQQGIYTLPTEYVNTQQYYWQSNMPYFTRPVSIVGKFTDEYTDTSNNAQRFPLFIGGGGHIDNYRFTHGTSYIQGLQSRTRYWQNFDVVDAPFPSVYDDYYQVGDIHTLTRTRYNTIQYYSMSNPATQQPWTTGLIETSGFLFGVKKL
jgi:hypothetical protein